MGGMQTQGRWLGVATLMVLITLLAVLPGTLSGRGNPAPQALPVLTGPPDASLLSRLQEIYAARARALLTEGDPTTLDPYYAPDGASARWALEREKRKLSYVRAWAENRGVRFTESEVNLRVWRLRVTGDRASLSLAHTLRLGYVYRGDAAPRVNTFGIGTRHAVDLVNKGGNWVIRREWYTDPLGEDSLVPEVAPATARGRCSPALAVTAPGPASGVRDTKDAAAGKGVRYNRRGAIQYADKYCGAAWGCGNNRRYNPRYRDLTYIGGDCTNFASQVLGDRDGGNLPADYTWYATRGGGSQAWVQTQGLADHLIRHGRARLVAKGMYHQLVRASEKHPRGAIAELQPGDLIAYQEKGKIEHFAVVTATDSRGYRLVNSHTADRYHVPWDLGWDRKTVFWLLRMRD